MAHLKMHGGGLSKISMLCPKSATYPALNYVQRVQVHNMLGFWFQSHCYWNHKPKLLGAWTRWVLTIGIEHELRSSELGLL